MGASGYNIYRGVRPGAESSSALNALPYKGVDPAPGVTAFLYNDPGLKVGQTYYYTVKALFFEKGKEVEVTNESSATPDSSAIPYDTCDPVQILGSVSGSALTMMRTAGASHGKTQIATYVQGPDGVGYALEPDAKGNLTIPKVYPPTSYYDDKTRLFHDSDGTTAPMPAF